MSNKKTMVDDVKHAIKDDQHSIDEYAPGTSFGLVALSYVAVLAIVCLIAAFVIWLF